MKYTLELTTAFKKDLKRCIKRGLKKNKFDKVVNILQKGEKLDIKYRDHQLVDSKHYKNCRECHIQPDWLLVYRIENNILVLTLLRTGTHSDLFEK